MSNSKDTGQPAFHIETATEQHMLAWDDYVSGHGSASQYHYWAWGDACTHAYGHQVIRLLAKRGEQIIGLLSLVVMRKPFLGTAWCSLPFCDVGGVLADHTEVEEALLNFALQSGCETFQQRLCDSEALIVEDQQSLGHPKVRMLLPLPSSAEALWDGFKSKLRSQVRKAEKNGLTVASGQSQTLLKDFYSVMCINMRALGSPVHKFEWFQAVADGYGERYRVAVVYASDRPIAGGIVLYGAMGTVIPWASTVPEFNHLSPNMMLYWHLISSTYQHNPYFSADLPRDMVFDFGRSSYMAGTFRFKKQWGAQPHLLNWQDVSQDASGKVAVENEKPGEEQSHLVKALLVKGWQNMPLAITNKIGPKLRGYISL